MTQDELDQAIDWFEKKPPMPGAHKMYELALLALKAIRVDAEYIDDLTREELVGMIGRLRTTNINRGRLIDRLEDENFELRKKAGLDV